MEKKTTREIDNILSRLYYTNRSKHPLPMDKITEFQNIEWVKVEDVKKLLKEHACNNPIDMIRIYKELK